MRGLPNTSDESPVAINSSSLYKFNCTCANASISKGSTLFPTTINPVAVSSQIKSPRVKFGNQSLYLASGISMPAAISVLRIIVCKSAS